MPTRALYAIARKELSDGLRNRWIWTVSALLATSVLVIAFFGAAPVGVTGATAGGAVMASLLNLAVYLVPLLALVLGCGAIIDEKVRGTLDLILVYPLSAGEYFWGTFLGFTLALAAAVVGGFGFSGALLYFWQGLDLGPYVALIGLAVVLGVVFLGLSFLLSLLSRDRVRAIVSSLFVWICFVLVFDLMLVGALVLSEGGIPSRVVSGLILLNPTDVFRILCFKWIAGSGAPLGLSGVMSFAPSTACLVAALIFWLLVPLAASLAIFRYRVARDSLV
jgi:Cu-processing system permease protein